MRRDAGVGRGLPVRTALDEQGRRDTASRAYRALGRARAAGIDRRFTPRRDRNHSLHRLSFSSHFTLWRGRQSCSHADCIRLGYAFWHFRLVLMPLGLDGFCWQLMGAGIDWMVKVALWTTTLPGALGRTTAFGGGTLLICSLGLVILCLLRTPLRVLGAALIAIAVAMM